jgi:hypothetical protein
MSLHNILNMNFSELYVPVTYFDNLQYEVLNKIHTQNIFEPFWPQWAVTLI